MKAFLEWLIGLRGTASFVFCLACEGGTLADWTAADAGQIAAWLASLNHPQAATGTYFVLTITFGVPCVIRSIELIKNLRRLLPKWRFGEKVGRIGGVADLLCRYRDGDSSIGYDDDAATQAEAEQAVSTLRSSLKEDGIDVPQTNLDKEADIRAIHEYVAGLKGCAETRNLREARKLRLSDSKRSLAQVEKSDVVGDLDDEIPF